MIGPQSRVRIRTTGRIGLVTRREGVLDGRQGWRVAMMGEPAGVVIAAEDELEVLTPERYLEARGLLGRRA